MPLVIQLGIGIVLSALIGVVAYRRGSLSRSGVVGAVIVGTAIFGFGGLAWGLVLIAFFVTSSVLSHYKQSTKEKLAEKFEKGQQRDLGQALANGGAGALTAIAFRFASESTAPLALAAFAGAMATVNADTWATELGVLNSRPPRMITTWREVEVGTSGGVSRLGLLAALCGGLLMGVIAWLLLDIGHGLIGCIWTGCVPGGMTGYRSASLLVPAAAIAGLAGSLFDSLLGATLQAIYFCPNCQRETERKLHSCGTPTRLLRGWRWLDNDWVNFISSLVGAALAAAVFAAVRR